MRPLCLLIAIPLVGCGSIEVVSSSPRTVVVKKGPGVPANSGTAEAQSKADVECKKHNRLARMVARPNEDSREWVFDCVE